LNCFKVPRACPWVSTIGSLEAGIVATGLSGFWTQFICGALIIVSVIIHTLAKRRKQDYKHQV